MRMLSAPFSIGLIGLIALMIAGGGIYFAQIQNVWIDESTQLSGMKLGINRLLLWLGGMAIPEFGVPADRMPPISYLIDGFFGRIVGFEPIGLRLLHLFITVSGVIALVLMMLKKFGFWAAAATGLFLALSPRLIEVSVEIRAYPIFLAITCFQIVMFVNLYEQDRISRLRIAGFALLGLLSAYTHFFGIVATSAFFTALFVGAKDRKSAFAVAVIYCGFLILCSGLVPFIAGANSISSVTERSTVTASGLIEFAFKLIGHSSTMLSVPAALIYFASVALMIGLTLSNVAQKFYEDGEAARANPVFGLVVALSSGLCATIAAAFVVRGFDPLKISYNIWVLPLIAVLIGVALTAKATGFVKPLQIGFASLLLIGALWTHGTFLGHAGWFVHGPEKTLVRQIEEAGPGTAVVYEGASWGYGYFPLYWRYREDVPQWLINAEGTSVQRIKRGGNIESESKPILILDQFDHLIYARIDTRTYVELRALMISSATTSEPINNARALANYGWRTKSVLEKPGLYWMTSTTLDRKTKPQ